MIEVSPKARDQVVQVMTREGKEGQYLRVSVVGGGCSGLSYKLSFEDKPKDKDNVLEFIELNILIDAKSALFVKGMTLDFTDGLDGQGFVFNNPNSKQSCGCGSSFSV
jgi:iron-sulfur cluster assembly protein